MKNEPLIIKPKRAKGDDGYKTFSIRVKDEIVDRIEEVCRKTGRSRNELIGTFIEYALDRCKIDDN